MRRNKKTLGFILFSVTTILGATLYYTLKIWNDVASNNSSLASSTLDVQGADSIPLNRKKKAKLQDLSHMVHNAYKKEDGPKGMNTQPVPVNFNPKEYQVDSEPFTRYGFESHLPSLKEVLAATEVVDDSLQSLLFGEKEVPKEFKILLEKFDETLDIPTQEDYNKTFGIVYFVYSKQESSAIHYAREAFLSALTIRAVEPSMSISLLTSTLHPKVENFLNTVFTSVIAIPDTIIYPGRQWMTRTQAMSLSPYNITLALDTDAFACSAFTDELLESFLETKVDMVFNGHEPKESAPIHPDNGVMMYKKSPEFKAMCDEWAQRMAHDMKNKAEFYDDQRLLKLTIKKNAQNLIFGRLNSKYSCRFRPAKDLPWASVGDHVRTHDHTLLLNGQVRLIHGKEHKPGWPEFCKFVNQKNETRVVVWDKRTDKRALAYSQKECDSLLGHPCLRFEWIEEKDIYVLGPHLNIVKNKSKK